MLTVTHEYRGMSDYWQGNGKRWDDNAGCLFAFYGPDTTLTDCVEQWVDDFHSGGDCDSLPDSVTADDIRKAILEAITAKLTNKVSDDDWDEDSESPQWIILVEYDKDSWDEYVKGPHFEEKGDA